MTSNAVDMNNVSINTIGSHIFDSLPCTYAKSKNISFQDCPPLLNIPIDKVGVKVETGVVDQDVNGAQVGLDPTKGGDDVILYSHITFEGMEFTRLIFQLNSKGFELFEASRQTHYLKQDAFLNKC